MVDRPRPLRPGCVQSLHLGGIPVSGEKGPHRRGPGKELQHGKEQSIWQVNAKQNLSGGSPLSRHLAAAMSPQQGDFEVQIQCNPIFRLNPDELLLSNISYSSFALVQKCSRISSKDSQPSVSPDFQPLASLLIRRSFA